MKVNTSISIDDKVFDKVRAVAAAEGEEISTFMERAARREVMYQAGQAVTDSQRRRGVNVEARALTDLSAGEIEALDQ